MDACNRDLYTALISFSVIAGELILAVLSEMLSDKKRIILDQVIGLPVRTLYVNWLIFIDILRFLRAIHYRFCNCQRTDLVNAGTRLLLLYIHKFSYYSKSIKKLTQRLDIILANREN